MVVENGLVVVNALNSNDQSIVWTSQQSAMSKLFNTADQIVVEWWSYCQSTNSNFFVSISVSVKSLSRA